MKLKIVLLTTLTFVFVACPSNDDDVYIEVTNFSIEASCSNIGHNLEDPIICNDEFKISLNFKSSSLAQQSRTLYSDIGNTYATYEPFVYLQNEVTKCSIRSTADFNGISVSTDINNYFELHSDNFNWIKDLSMVEGINEIIRLEYKTKESAYLKLKANSEINYAGRIVVQLEFSDGTILKDSTNNILINAK